MFSNLTTEIFVGLKQMCQTCYYSVSAKSKCWKFMFDDHIGVALIKHEAFTKYDNWSIVAIKKENNEYFPIDTILMNVSEAQIFDYTNFIKELYL